MLDQWALKAWSRLCTKESLTQYVGLFFICEVEKTPKRNNLEEQQ